ncbi:MAG: hypothetical protein JWO67_3712 [Streptosporangiaceae bacterium]|jgi:hypothetical protein|nr:hypothetical protein [Streptosporangiaceae bacterium]
MGEAERQDDGPGTPPTDPVDRGPGAHSGHESQPQERIVPGTASAAEGYSEGGGTRDGDPLAGVEAQPEKTRQAGDTDEEVRESTASGRSPYDD